MSFNKKLLEKIAAEYILGINPVINLSGDAKKVECIKEVLVASRKLFLCLESSDKNLEQVLLLSSKKNIAAKEFKRQFRFDWEL